LKIWMTPRASVAMLEKFALLKMALCSALALTMDSSVWPSTVEVAAGPGRGSVEEAAGDLVIGFPDSET